MRAIEDAVAAVRAGSLVVLPTDTVYGIGARPDDPDATDALFRAKGRPGHLELPVLVASTTDARAVARFDDRAEALAASLWPGAVTLVLPRTDAAAAWRLGGDPETVGVRVPDEPVALAVLTATGPMAVTSANPSGQPPLTDADALLAAFGDEVAVYLCRDEPLEGLASTVVDLAHGEPRILRAGSISADEIASLLA